MKRVISGKTYDTDTATAVARYENENNNGETVECVVYVNKGGVYFETNAWIQEDDGGERLEKSSLSPLTSEDIDRLLAGRTVVEILDEEKLPPPPEASSEDEREPDEAVASVYLRMPVLLKIKFETAARQARQSLNAWAISKLEAGL
jgi:hypothetical protein